MGKFNFATLEPKRMSFKHKDSKFLYYVKNYFNQLTPISFYQKRLQKKLDSFYQLEKTKQERVLFRVNYYNKLTEKLSLSDKASKLSEIVIKEHKKPYFFDFYAYHKYFNQNKLVRFIFGDVVKIPNEPAFVKSRPISSSNANSILLKWNKIRHFIYIKNEKKQYRDKKDQLVFRAKVRKALTNRVDFLSKYFDHPMCNAGDVVTVKPFNPAWRVNRMTIDEQLAYKFILSLEGNDVASNLKWIMSSQSIAVMPKPKFETWFMEGTLVPNVHYIEIKDDFSDLEERLTYYINNPEEAEKIVKNANDYVAEFKDKKTEDLVSLMVLKKYFEKTGQA